MPLAKKAATPTAEAPAQPAATAPALTTGGPTGALPPAGAPMQTKAPAKADNGTMSKAEWAAKDRRISRAGVWQAALQSMAGLQFNQGGTLDSFLDVVDKMADRGLQYVNRE